MPDLTPEKLAELRRMLDAATPRPWIACEDEEEVLIVLDDDSNHWPVRYTAIARGFEQGDDYGLSDAMLVTAAVNALPALLEACYGDPTVGTAPAVLVWTAVPARTEWKYAYLAHRMIAMEAGHSAQNVYLGGAAVGVGACAVLGYNQTRLDALLGVDGREEFALYVMPVGRPAGDTP